MTPIRHRRRLPSLAAAAVLAAVALLPITAAPGLAQPSDNVYCGEPVTDVGEQLTAHGAAAALDALSENQYRRWLDPIFGDNREVCGLGLAAIEQAAGSRFVKILVGRTAFQWIRTVQRVGDLPREELVPATPREIPAVGPAGGVQAPVSWTDGYGLWLNGGPGTDPLQVVPEGTTVTLLCSTLGPIVTGPYGPTTIWNYARTPNGATGYMSDAYLYTGSDGTVVQSC